MPCIGEQGYIPKIPGIYVSTRWSESKANGDVPGGNILKLGIRGGRSSLHREQWRTCVGSC